MLLVSEDFNIILLEAKEKRNFLAHDYFRERAYDFMTNEGCLGMIAELKSILQLLEDADQQLEKIVDPLRKKYNIKIKL
jgi:hypothetical protein